ncbi:Protein N-Terminal Asparagine Amidohydrolase [Manis pentadactyla]|nr:Protein N-Terminal Asparagine Amidohydrolase [Manis pentadactyla]
MSSRTSAKAIKWKHPRPREEHSDRSLILALPDKEKPQLMEGLSALPCQVGPLGEPLPVPGSVSHLGQEDPSTCQTLQFPRSNEGLPWSLFPRPQHLNPSECPNG